MAKKGQPPPRTKTDASALPDVAPDSAARQIRGGAADVDGQRSDDSDLRTQNERDQSSDAVGDELREVIRQAKRDIDAGLVDTDLRSTPGLDAERREKLLAREKTRSGGKEAED